jgi:hypothetical protein
MARRYTMTDVTTEGSSVQAFRNKIKNNQSGKGYSDDRRMRSMFPKSPLYSTGSADVNDVDGLVNDSSIINNFKSFVIDSEDPINSYDFIGTDVAYMNAGFHPNAPDLDRNKLHKPIPDIDTNYSADKPYYGHPNLQVSSINPLDTRASESLGLLRERNNADGGFGRRYKTNEATSLANDGTTHDATSTMINIGQYFSKIYGSTDADKNALSKKNLLGSSRATTSTDTAPSTNDTGTPSTN